MTTQAFGDFEWESTKAESNIVDHGVSFEEASTVFDDLTPFRPWTSPTQPGSW